MYRKPCLHLKLRWRKLASVCDQQQFQVQKVRWPFQLQVSARWFPFHFSFIMFHSVCSRQVQAVMADMLIDVNWSILESKTRSGLSCQNMLILVGLMILVSQLHHRPFLRSPFFDFLQVHNIKLEGLHWFQAWPPSTQPWNLHWNCCSWGAHFWRKWGGHFSLKCLQDGFHFISVSLRMFHYVSLCFIIFAPDKTGAGKGGRYVITRLLSFAMGSSAMPYSLQAQMVTQLRNAAKLYPSEFRGLIHRTEPLTIASLCAGFDVAHMAINALSQVPWWQHVIFAIRII